MPLESREIQPAQRLSYKFQRLREQLRQAIETGELAGRLPGERHLGRRFRANAKTINKALGDLSAEGLVVRYIGRGTFVAGSDAQACMSQTRTWWWVSGPGAGYSDAIFAAAQRKLMDADVRHVIVPMPVSELGARAVGKSLRDVDGIVLCGAIADDRMMAELARRHIPTVVMGGDPDNRRADSILSDDADAGFRLTEYLFQLGHRKIFVVAGRNVPQDDSVQIESSPACARDPSASLRIAGSSSISDNCGRDPATAAADRVYTGYHAACRRRRAIPASRIDRSGLAALMRDSESAGLIAVGVESTRNIAKWLAASGQRGRDMELTCVLEPGESYAATSALTAYEVPVERLADWAVRLLHDSRPGQPPVQVVVPGRLVVRGSASVRAVRYDTPATPVEAVI